MPTSLTPTERQEIAKQLGLNEQYLYQCLAGRRNMNPAEARRVEEQTGGRLRRQDLCQETWRSIWPELAEVKGGKRAPASTKAA